MERIWSFISSAVRSKSSESAEVSTKRSGLPDSPEEREKLNLAPDTALSKGLTASSNCCWVRLRS
ncbi:MAG: hypothetical protein BWY75_03755 [bacterium ADurb.Bin425]|nr:MAG: hypothetical protein BWY75_03755 [bacterium ADurb.Bin425]